ncbi:MAG: hypothetical protein ACK5LC_06780 [Coprobacillaceae bacterium]
MKIDWIQNKQVLSHKKLWDTVSFIKEDLDDISLALINKFALTHVNGGMQIHRYRIDSNSDIQWYIHRNRLQEIEFLKNLLSHKDLVDFRNDLDITIKNPNKDRLISYHTDIFSLVGSIARNLYQGGAYEHIECDDAWNTAITYVEEAFQNRFDEVLFMNTSIFEEPGSWFYDVAWDYSWILVDKRYNRVTLISITDTD